MKEKLSRITSPWHRFMVTVVVHCVLFISKFAGRYARIHWVGSYHRRLRLEHLKIILRIILLFLLAIIILEQHQFVLWSTLVGGTASLFVVLHTIYRLIPRKRSDSRGVGEL
jgi:accessory gene regulator protein AgrB